MNFNKRMLTKLIIFLIQKLIYHYESFLSFIDCMPIYLPFSKAYLVIGCPSFDQLTVSGASPEALHSMAILVDPGTTFILVGVTATSGDTVED